VDHNCNGDYFIADGEHLYRCHLDSTLIPAHVPFIECPNCGRIVDADNRGIAPVLTVTMVTRFAVLSSGREIKLDELKREEWKSS